MPKSYFKSADWDKDVPQQDAVPVSYKEKKLKNETESDTKLHKIDDNSKAAFKSAKKVKKVTRDVKVSSGDIQSVIEKFETKLSIKKKHKKKTVNPNSKTTQENASPMQNIKKTITKHENNANKLDLVKASNQYEPAEVKLALAKKKKHGNKNKTSVGRTSKTDETSVITENKVKEKKVKAANNVLLKEDEKIPDLSPNKKVSSKRKLKLKPVSINYVTAPKLQTEKQTSKLTIKEETKLETLKAKRIRKAKKQNTIKPPGNCEEQVHEKTLSTRLKNGIKWAETIEKATKMAKVGIKKNKALEMQKNELIPQVKLKKQAILKNILEGTPNPDAMNNEVKLERVSFRNRHLQTSLRKRMMEKLKAAQFRFLNEKLYLSEGKDAKELFQTDPDSYSIYHEGFRQQMKKWPINPLDIIIKEISAMSKDTKVADLGCGDGVLAKSVPQQVRSFDLVSSDPSVEACDMAHTPLLAGEVNVVVFCLALMGTNMNDYLIEANRVLKIGGTMKIAEVESRFQDVEHFIQAVEKFGFSLKKKDLSHNIFYFMDFKKHREVGKRNKLPYLKLKPCLYKKR